MQAAHERSIERSYLRLRVLLMLASLTEAFPRQLAASCAMDCGRLQSILFGDGKDYSFELGLVPLGLVDLQETKHGKVYRITRRGARKARQLAARVRRREEFRVANRAIREMKGERAGPRVWPRPAAADREPVTTPVAGPSADTASFRWRVEDGEKR